MIGRSAAFARLAPYNGRCFPVSADQLLKGAASNAVQTAEELLK
jgi:aspartate-semialdehyde dehydrogenase